MSWLNTASIASLAKSALKEAQKTIDKALDIKENLDISISSPANSGRPIYTTWFFWFHVIYIISVFLSAMLGKEIENFFESYGLAKDAAPESSEKECAVVMTKEPNSTSQWDELSNMTVISSVSSLSLDSSNYGVVQQKPIETVCDAELLGPRSVQQSILEKVYIFYSPCTIFLSNFSTRIISLCNPVPFIFQQSNEADDFNTGNGTKRIPILDVASNSFSACQTDENLPNSAVYITIK